jgi:hypothetical protein
MLGVRGVVDGFNKVLVAGGTTNVLRRSGSLPIQESWKRMVHFVGLSRHDALDTHLVDPSIAEIVEVLECRPGAEV